MTAQNRPDNDPIPEPTLFSAIITPHRSLVRHRLSGGDGADRRRQLRRRACVFFLLGAWPVIGFLGLDVLLVYWAFRANYRAAAAYEEVTVTPSELRLRQVSHRGEVARMDAQSAVDASSTARRHEEFGLLRLFLVSRGRRLAVAGFLSPQEKESFAAALSAALGEAKRGPTRTVR